MEKVYLGIDVGSISTNLAVINEENRVIRGIYLRTEGDPIKAVNSGLLKLKDLFLNGYRIAGCGTTGSARRLIGFLVGSDVVKNEIIAHAKATLLFYPDTQTILEIGGQDSKIIIIREGVVVDFAMNTVCAGGTGAFLEHQAHRLGIPIEEFGKIAKSTKKGVKIASRCTVFAESDMIHKAQLGVPKEQIVRGLCRAVVANYLSNVAKGKKIRQRIVFQGGVAANEGVREAFREALGEEITVPEHFAIMGAIGAAIIAKEMNIKETKFIGFQSEEMNFKSQVTECFGCDNNCEIVILQNKAGIIDYFGSRCGSPSL